jgi:glutaredoxin
MKAIYRISDANLQIRVLALKRCMMTASVLILASWFGAAHAQLYKWVGPDGKVNYTDTPPPPSARSSEQKALSGGNTVAADLPYALAQTVKKNPVTLYTMSDCTPCTQARQLLTTRGIPFTEKTIQTPEDLAQLKKLGGSQLPFLLIGSSSEEGFEASQWNSRLTAAAYPETSQLPNTYRNPAAEPAAPSAEPKTKAAVQSKNQPRPSPVDALPPAKRPNSASDFRF